MPGAFLIATLILLLFAVGYAQMAKKLVSAGGFYAFVVKGLGRPMGLVAGYIALLGYNCFVAGAIGTSGFFTATVIKDLAGIDLPWFAWSLITVGLIFLLTRRGIDFSAKVLGGLPNPGSLDPPGTGLQHSVYPRVLTRSADAADSVLRLAGIGVALCCQLLCRF